MDGLKTASRVYINPTYGGGQITVPKEMVNALGYENKEKLKLEYTNNKLIVTKL